MCVRAHVIAEAIAELFEGMGMRIGRSEGIERVFHRVDQKELGELRGFGEVIE